MGFSPTEKFRTRDGKIHDSRQIHGLTRDRTGGSLKYKRTRADQKKLLIKQGCEFLDGTPKYRYVAIYGDRRMKRMLRRALRWKVSTYPKREPICENNSAEFDYTLGEISNSGLDAAHVV